MANSIVPGHGDRCADLAQYRFARSITTKGIRLADLGEHEGHEAIERIDQPAVVPELERLAGLGGVGPGRV